MKHSYLGHLCNKGGTISYAIFMRASLNEIWIFTQWAASQEGKERKMGFAASWDDPKTLHLFIQDKVGELGRNWAKPGKHFTLNRRVPCSVYWLDSSDKKVL